MARGQVIDLSLLEPMFSVLGPEAAIYKVTGKVKQRSGSASNTASPRNVYRCRGRQICRPVGFDAAGGAAHLRDHRPAAT